MHRALVHAILSSLQLIVFGASVVSCSRRSQPTLVPGHGEARSRGCTAEQSGVQGQGQTEAQAEGSEAEASSCSRAGALVVQLHVLWLVPIVDKRLGNLDC